MFEDVRLRRSEKVQKLREIDSMVPVEVRRIAFNVAGTPIGYPAVSLRTIRRRQARQASDQMTDDEGFEAGFGSIGRNHGVSGSSSSRGEGALTSRLFTYAVPSITLFQVSFEMILAPP